jgi:hypothetical protein
MSHDHSRDLLVKNGTGYHISRYEWTRAEINKRLNFIDIPNAFKLKNFRILGLMAIISYMIVILFVWIYANIGGYVYFLAGEPNLVIKYTEWLLGFAGIFVAIDLLHKELNEIV